MTEGQTIEHRPSSLAIRGLSVEVVSGPDTGKSKQAPADKLSIGTAAGNDLVLSDDTVSRYHVELINKDGRIRVRDLDSTNRTMVGRAMLGWADIEPGTVLRLGRTEVRVKDGGTVAIDLLEGDTFSGVRGKTASMRALMHKADRVARSETSVLLLGETGTGKEMFARAIHASSPRHDGPFETVDCGALLPSLVVSELFGHEPGAFTGAQQQHVGAFERAHGGTLFLDEVGELAPQLQPVLLGALERRSFRRVGGSKPINVDVRLISATNRDLREAVNARTFREDLYFRLGVVTLSLPPLRERPNDIPMLAEFFAHEAGWAGALSDLLKPEEHELLLRYRWPGNVRELRNFVEAALAMGEAPSLAVPAGASQENAQAPNGYSSLPLASLLGCSYKDARAMVLDEFEQLYLEALLERAQGNVSQAAREAQMNRSYLLDLLKRKGLR